MVSTADLNKVATNRLAVLLQDAGPVAMEWDGYEVEFKSASWGALTVKIKGTPDVDAGRNLTMVDEHG